MSCLGSESLLQLPTVVIIRHIQLVKVFGSIQQNPQTSILYLRSALISKRAPDTKLHRVFKYEFFPFCSAEPQPPGPPGRFDTCFISEYILRMRDRKLTRHQRKVKLSTTIEITPATEASVQSSTQRTETCLALEESKASAAIWVAPRQSSSHFGKAQRTCRKFSQR